MRIKIKNKNTILLILLVASIIFMGIGYSAINSVTGEIDATATAEVQSGVFITDVELESQVDADINTSKINNYTGTTMNSTIVLSPTNPSSEIVYKVTVYNNGDKNETYLGAIYDEEFYDNLGIIFEVEGINLDDEIAPKETKEFTIKFKYKDGIIPDSNILNSYINFKFGDPNRLMFADYQAETYLNSGIARDKIEDIKFVYGEVPSSGVISFFDASEKQNESIWGYYTDADGNGMYELTFTSTEPIYANVNSSCLFYDLLNVKIINFDNFSTKGTTNMQAMFSISEENYWNYKDMLLEDIIGLEKFDTSQVTDMSAMFCGCGTLESLNFSSFNTSQVTNMSRMFDSCYILSNINVSNFNTSNVTDMKLMFSGAGVTNLDLSSFDTRNVTNMAAMFEGCRNLINLNLSTFNTSKVTDMSFMFNFCASISELDISTFDTGNVKNMSTMFQRCENLQKINFDINKFNTGQVTDMSYMFSRCFKLKDIDVSKFNTSQVTDMSWMFFLCEALIELDLSTFDTSNVTNMEGMIADCTNLKSLDISGFNTSKVTNMTSMFEALPNLTYIDISSFDTSNVTNMCWMFWSCLNLETLDLSSFNTSKVTDMSYMFSDIDYSGNSQGTAKLKTIYVSEYDESTDTGWTTKSVTNSTNMFTHCTNLVGGNGTKYDDSHIDKEYARIDKYGEPGYLTNKNPVENRLKYSNFQSSTFMDSGVARDKIEDIKFIYGEVPNTGVISQFDASEKQDGSITGYYTDIDNNNLYELTFVSKETIYTNKDSNRLFYNFINVKSITFDNISTKGTTNMLAMFSNCYELTSIDVSKFDTSEVIVMEGMFGVNNDNYEMKLEEIVGLENFDTSKVQSMYGMFMNCRHLTKLNLSNFNTENVVHMDAMFYNCKMLDNLDVNKFDTSNVTSMRWMFYGCSLLTNLDVSNFNTSQVTTMKSMFYECSSLTSLDLSKFDTGNVTDMSFMFCLCNGLTSLDVSKFDTNKVTDMSYMFASCSNLQSLDVSNFDTSNVTMMSVMFGTVTMNGEIMSITEIKGLENFKTNKVTDMGGMFANCIKLKDIDISNFDTENLKGAEFMFLNCRNITKLNLKNFRTDNAVYIDGLFAGCSSLKEIDLSSFNTSKVQNTYNMFNGCTNLETIYVSEYDEATDTGWTTKNVTNSEYMFTNCTSLVGGIGTTFDPSHIDKEYARIDKAGEPGYLTKQIKNGTLMQVDENSQTYFNSGIDKTEIETITFAKGDVPTSGIISQFDASVEQDKNIIGYYTDKDGDNLYELTFVTNGTIYTNENSANLFKGLTKLTTITFDNINTEKTTNMKSMFASCVDLQSIDLSNFNTINVTTMDLMFIGCSKLEKIKFGDKFSTQNVTNMSYMFQACSVLTSLDLTEFNTSNVTNMSYMFYNCRELTTIDLSSFNTSKVTNMRNMFYNCGGLTTIYASEYNEATDTGWSTKSVTNSIYMFNNNLVLVGGNGTKFDSSHIDKEYARIDKAGAPGYFTNITDKQ